MQNSLFGSVIVVLLLVLLAGCQSRKEQPSDNLIWKGYSAVLAQLQDAEQKRMLSDANAYPDKYMIKRTDLSTVVVNDPQKVNNSCLPDILQASKNPVRGQSFLARIIRKADREDFLTLDFTQWEGSNSWWVSTTAYNARCVRIEGN